MPISPAIMRLALDELKKKDRSYFHARPYTDFMPQKLNNRQPANEEAFYSAIAPVAERGRNRTSLVQQQAKNQEMQRVLKQAKAGNKRAQQLLSALRQAEPNVQQNRPGTIDLSGIDIGMIKGTRGGRGHGVRVGHGGKIQLGGGKWVDPQHLGNIRPGATHGGTLISQGHSTVVSQRYAPLFQGFLNALTRKGYKINSLGGYANRNIAGTSTRSLHSYGLAIDINPSANPVSYGHNVTNLPRGIGKLAAQYGLVWGGNWNGSKRDPMHFSIPYRGTK